MQAAKDQVSVSTRYALLRDMAKNAPDLIPPGTYIPTIEEEQAEIAQLTRPVQETIRERERAAAPPLTVDTRSLQAQLDRIEGTIDMLTMGAEDLKRAADELRTQAGEIALAVSALRA